MNNSRAALQQSTLSRRQSVDRMQIATARCVQSLLTQHKQSVLSLAATDALLFSGTQGGEINVWDTHTYLLRKSLYGHRGAVFCLVLSADNSILFSGSGDGTVRAWDTATLTCLYAVQALPSVGDILALAYSEQTGCLYLGCQNTSIQWFDTRRQDTLDRPPTEDEHADTASMSNFFRQGPVRPTTFTVQTDGDTGTATPATQSDRSEEEEAEAAELLAQQLAGQLPVKRYWIREEDVEPSSHYGYIHALFLADLPFLGGQILLSGAGDGNVKLWQVKDGPPQHVRTLNCGTGNVLALAVQQDELLFCGCQGGEIKIWDLETFQHIRSLIAHSDDVMALTVSGGSMFSGSADGSIKRWSRGFECIQMANGHDGIVLSLTFAGPYLVSGAGDHFVKFWDVGKHLTQNLQPDSSPADMMLYALEQLVAIPSVSGNNRHREDCRQAASFLKGVLRQLGAEAKMIYSKEGHNPLVIGRFARNAEDAAHRRPARPKLNVLVYGHYDVVPVDESLWKHAPFQLTGENGYLYGRGVTDDKGPMLAAIFAVSELQEERSLDVDVSFLIEGEEENGSAGFPEMVEEHKSYFGEPDVILLSNSYWLGENRPCLTYGLRGLIHATIKISSTARDVHSGVDGGAASQPLMHMIKILAQLTGSDGSLCVPSFKDGIRAMDASEDTYYDEIAAAVAGEDGSAAQDPGHVAAVKQQLMSRWRYPTFTVHRVDVSGPHNATVISRSATAYVSLRIVPDQSIGQICQDFEEYVRRQFDALQTDCTIKITIRKTADWWLSDPSHCYAQTMLEAIEQEWGQKPLLIREGGTIPAVRWLERCFDSVALNLPMGQASDSAHLNDERIRLHNLLAGKRVVKRFLAQLAQSQPSTQSN